MGRIGAWSSPLLVGQEKVTSTSWVLHRITKTGNREEETIKIRYLEADRVMHRTEISLVKFLKLFWPKLTQVSFNYGNWIATRIIFSQRFGWMFPIKVTSSQHPWPSSYNSYLVDSFFLISYQKNFPNCSFLPWLFLFLMMSNARTWLFTFQT